MEKLQELVYKLISYPDEKEWLEFKHDNYDPEMIGRDISALANGATLKGKGSAYMIWGVNDMDHSIVGTNRNLQNIKYGNEELENWLHRLLSPDADFTYHSVTMDKEGVNVGVLVINQALKQPVAFKKVEYIRVGSYTKKLSDYPAIRTELWDKLRMTEFEVLNCVEDLNAIEVLRLLNYSYYFDLTGIPQPSEKDDIIHYLQQDRIIKKLDNGLFGITNMGAILFAKKLQDFPKIERKKIRIVQYDGNNRENILKSEDLDQGYACVFEDAMTLIRALVPGKEKIEGAVREAIYDYPIVAIREALANALIHQDFMETGTSVLVEIFANRIEITNPGTLLIDPLRIVDNPPKSRNEKLASLMRRMRLCEELGTGWDRMIIACEMAKNPAPILDVYERNVKVTLKTNIPYKEYTPEQRVWSCYMHAVIKYIQGERITNSTIRERFGMPATSSASISRLLNEAVKQGFIKEFNPKNTARRYKEYIPIWG